MATVMTMIQEHKISLNLQSGEVLDVTIYDSNIATQVEEEMMGLVEGIAVESVDIEHINYYVPADSLFLEGWYTVGDLQEAIVGILAGLRGENATTIELPEYVLIMFKKWIGDEFCMADFAVWEKGTWEKFKEAVDQREIWPIEIWYATNDCIILENQEDVRMAIQSTELDELGPVFFGMDEGLPTGEIIGELKKLVLEEEE